MLRILLWTLVGWLVPIRYSGRRLLRLELLNNGVDIQKIPSACLDELAEQAIRTGKNIALLRGGNIRNEVVGQIEGEAVAIALILIPPNREIDRVDQDYRRRFVPILERHGVQVPA